MAYAAVVTVQRKGNDYLVQISETEAGAATEATITGVPIRGRILRQQATKTAGTAATIDPILGNATNPSAATASIVVSNDTAAATIDNVSSPAVPYISSTGTLYHRSVCASASDNSVTTLYYISGSTAANGW